MPTKAVITIRCHAQNYQSYPLSSGICIAIDISEVGKTPTTVKINFLHCHLCFRLYSVSLACLHLATFLTKSNVKIKDRSLKDFLLRLRQTKSTLHVFFTRTLIHNRLFVLNLCCDNRSFELHANFECIFHVICYIIFKQHFPLLCNWRHKYTISGLMMRNVTLNFNASWKVNIRCTLDQVIRRAMPHCVKQFFSSGILMTVGRLSIQVFIACFNSRQIFLHLKVHVVYWTFLYIISVQ
jgi:hypothetical protein